jgi:hypothetical protein
LYTGENDATWLERGRGIELDQKVLEVVLSKLSTDPVSNDFVNPSPPCTPIFLDQAIRSVLLKEMPTLDDTDVTMRQVGDTSQGMHIHDMDAVGDQGGAGATSGSGKRKEKEVPTGPASKAFSQSPYKDSGGSSNRTASSKKKRRLIRSAGRHQEGSQRHAESKDGGHTRSEDGG